jgi:hypothetical protein
MLRGIQDQVERYFASATLDSFQHWGAKVGGNGRNGGAAT